MQDYIELPAEDAREFAYNDKGNAWQGLRVEENRQIDEGRWCSVHELILEKTETGELFCSTYERGLTECQDTRPFEDEPTVRFMRCTKVPVEAFEYRVQS